MVLHLIHHIQIPGFKINIDVDDVDKVDGVDKDILNKLQDELHRIIQELITLNEKRDKSITQLQKMTDKYSIIFDKF